MLTESANADRDRLFASLRIPLTSAGAVRVFEAHAGEIWFYLERLIDDELVTHIWSQWNPDQMGRLDNPAFQAAFKAMLSKGVGMGYRLDRFLDISRSLPDPSDNPNNWVEPFERAIAGRGRSNFRIVLSPADYAEYLNTNSAERDDDRWDGMLSLLADGLFYELGIVYPPIEVGSDETLPDGFVRFEFNDAVLPPRRGLRAGQILVNVTAERLQPLSITGEDSVNPANGYAATVVSAVYKQQCDGAGYTTWDHRGYTILMASSLLRLKAGAFVHRYFVDYCLTSLSKAHPRLIEAIDGAMDRDHLAQVLRQLLDEDISIRDFSAILNVLVSPAAPLKRSIDEYITLGHNACSFSPGKFSDTVSEDVCRVRIALKQYIGHKYSRGTNTLSVYRIDADSEKRLRQPIPLSAEECDALLAAIRLELPEPSTDERPVILTTPEVRWQLRQLIGHAFPRLAILCHQELPLDVNAWTVGDIELHLVPYDKSFWQLSIIIDDEPMAGGLDSDSEDKLVHTLQERAESIKERVAAELVRNYPIPKPHTMTGVVAECFDAYVELLNGRRNHLEKLCRVVSERAAPGFLWSRIVEVFLRMAGNTRHVLAIDLPHEMQSLAMLNEDAARLEAVAHNAACFIADEALALGARERHQ